MQNEKRNIPLGARVRPGVKELAVAQAQKENTSLSRFIENLILRFCKKDVER